MFARLFKQWLRPRTIRRRPRRSWLTLERLEDRIVPTPSVPPYFVLNPSCDMDT